MSPRKIILAILGILLIVSSITYYSLRESVITSAIDATGLMKAEIVGLGDGTILGRTYRIRITKGHDKPGIMPEHKWLDELSDFEIRRISLHWISRQELQIILDDDGQTWRIQPLLS